jgi:hypothetical protein
MLTLVIKGGLFDALKAAERRKIHIDLSPSQERDGETHAVAPTSEEGKIGAWFAEGHEAPFQPGDLLFYGRGRA